MIYFTLHFHTEAQTGLCSNRPHRTALHAHSSPLRKHHTLDRSESFAGSEGELEPGLRGVLDGALV